MSARILGFPEEGPAKQCALRAGDITGPDGGKRTPLYNVKDDDGTCFGATKVNEGVLWWSADLIISPRSCHG